MGYGGGFGGEADTGGVAGGSSNNGGGVSGKGGGGYGGAVGHGVDSAHGGNSSVGSDGSVSGLGNGSNSNSGANESSSSSATYGGTFGNSLDARSATDAQAGSSMTGTAAMVSMDQAAEEAKSNFGFASQVDAKLGPNNVGYGALSDSAYGQATAPSVSAEAITAAQNVAGLPEAIAMASRPGIMSRGLSIAASLANPALGVAATAFGAHSAAKNAQASIGAINDAFGTTMDDSYGTALGQQALGTASGLLGGKVGGKVGAGVGMSVGGVPGAMVGGLLGSAFGSNAARGAAMGPNGSTDGPEGPAAGGDAMSDPPSPGQAIASAPAKPRSGYVSIDNYAMGSDRNPFDRYSDYAAQFFGTA